MIGIQFFGTRTVASPRNCDYHLQVYIYIYTSFLEYLYIQIYIYIYINLCKHGSTGKQKTTNA